MLATDVLPCDNLVLDGHWALRLAKSKDRSKKISVKIRPYDTKNKIMFEYEGHQVIAWVHPQSGRVSVTTSLPPEERDFCYQAWAALSSLRNQIQKGCETDTWTTQRTQT